MYIVRRGLRNGIIPLLIAVVLSLLGFALAASSALGQVPGPGDPAPVPDGPALTAIPLGIVAASFVMTGIGYALNYVLPFLKTDKAKGVAHVVYQAIGVAAYEVATASDLGFNEQTLTAFVTALAVFGFSHGLLFKPTGWAYTLGAGRNKSDIQRVKPVTMARPATLGLTSDPHPALSQQGRWV